MGEEGLEGRSEYDLKQVRSSAFLSETVLASYVTDASGCIKLYCTFPNLLSEASGIKRLRMDGWQQRETLVYGCKPAGTLVLSYGVIFSVEPM